MNSRKLAWSNPTAKPRLKWSRALHERFTDAVAHLGGAEKATPKSVMRIMGVPGLTLYHLKSHLQKYRLAQSQGSGGDDDSDDSKGCSKPSITSGWNFQGAVDTETTSSRKETKENMLQMQMEVQRQLMEQIEVQKHLQLRIEAQGKYLQSVLKKAKETLASYNLDPAIQFLKTGNDHSVESCVTTSERWEKKSEEIKSDTEQSEQTSLEAAGDLLQDSRGEAPAESAQEQTDRRGCQELFDLNR